MVAILNHDMLYNSIYLSLFFFLSIYLSIYRSIYLSIYLSFSLSLSLNLYINILKPSWDILVPHIWPHCSVPPPSIACPSPGRWQPRWGPQNQGGAQGPEAPRRDAGRSLESWRMGTISEKSSWFFSRKTGETKPIINGQKNRVFPKHPQKMWKKNNGLPWEKDLKMMAFPWFPFTGEQYPSK